MNLDRNVDSEFVRRTDGHVGHLNLLSLGIRYHAAFHELDLVLLFPGE